MDVGIIGSGVVGQTVGAKLAAAGNDVVLGTRSPEKLDEKRGFMAGSLAEWLEATGGMARVGSFADAASHGELIINATLGSAAVEALEQAGRENLAGKIVMDISNPLDFSKGMPPSLTVCNTDSLGEQIQRAFPEARVVKTLNTVTAPLMVAPLSVGGAEHTLFISGNDAAAKEQVVAWLREWFGWQDIIDLGDITSARATEMILPAWVRLMGALGTPMFNFRVVR